MMPTCAAVGSGGSSSRSSKCSSPPAYTSMLLCFISPGCMRGCDSLSFVSGTPTESIDTQCMQGRKVSNAVASLIWNELQGLH